MEEKFIINGGKALRGEIEVRGAKNAAFPIIAATLLTKEECVIDNLPLIEDVFRMVDILKSLGSEVSWIGERKLRIKNSDINLAAIKEEVICLLRGSVLLMGPILARFGKLDFPQPGGCVIGARPIDVHLDGLKQLGVKISKNSGRYSLEARLKKDAAEIILDEFSVTATENIMLFASSLETKTVINTCDQDYQVQELAKFLSKMGAGIEGAGTHKIIVKGAKHLKGASHFLMYDPIEAGTFIITAAATRGNVLVKNVETDFLTLPLKKLQDFGVPLEIGKNSVRVRPWKALKIDKVQSLPYPGIPTDLQSALGVLSTLAKGSTLMHDPLYEGRLKYLEELNKMGAEIYLADPHRAIINGPTKLYGQELGSLDLRGGAALVIAGLIAKGKTVINNIYQIDRGYEKIEERLRKLGADIKRVGS